jgi:tetratricopeptide (TPR) repeat protein
MTENDTALARLDERLDQSMERLARVEGLIEAERSRSLQKAMAIYGGYLALVISILTGAYTLYDNLVVRPEREQALKEAAVRGKISELSSLIARALRAMAENPMNGGAEAAALAPQRLQLIEEIEAGARDMPYLLRFPDYLLLSNEYEGWGRFPEALYALDRARKAAGDWQQLANLDWATGRVNAQIGDMGRAREHFDRAIGAFRSAGVRNNGGSMMLAYLQWLYGEFTNGDCAGARTVFEKMSEDFANPGMAAAVRTESRRQLSMIFSSTAETCELNQMELGG